jgi:TonB family protein
MGGNNMHFVPFISRLVGHPVRFSGVATLALVLAMPAFAGTERAGKVRVANVYPEIAKRLGIEGAVKVEATVEADGKVADVKTLSGNHMLATAAEDAVRKWKFAAGSGADKVEVEELLAGALETEGRMPP